MKNIKLVLVFGLIFSLVSCESTELDLTSNPNALVPEQADVDFLLSSIQEDFVRQLEGSADFDPNDNFQSGGNTTGDGFFEIGMEMTRIVQMAGRNYNSVYQGSDFGDEWINCYRGILADLKAMNPLAEEAGLSHHIAIGQFIEAFVMVTMVDFFGDVPYSEAIQEGNFNPKLDSGADIYAQMLNLLDQAIANFGSSASSEPNIDLYYAGDYDQWIKAANTLKLKIYLQTRLVDSNAMTSFNQIIASGNYIQDTADDLIYSWPATSPSQPDSRHPRYGINYTTGGAGEYMSNWLMNLMDTTDDPRIRFYFYRQTNAVPGQEIPPNEELLRCSLQTPPQHYINGGFTFCNLPNGYWGRDHGNALGIPPDGLLRTTWGVYPVGGMFDDDRFAAVSATSGGGGAGISNILTAFGVDFMLAEAAMIEGDFVGARDAMLAAFDKQMDKVLSFSALDASADLSLAPTATEITSYRNNLSSTFDAADTDGKWDILGEQYWIAHYGNGVEPYNFYRRTGFPSTLQPNLEPDPGTFIQSLYYPTNSVNNNSNISQKADHTQPVFWDNNGAPLAN